MPARMIGKGNMLCRHSLRAEYAKTNGYADGAKRDSDRRSGYYIYREGGRGAERRCVRMYVCMYCVCVGNGKKGKEGSERNKQKRMTSKSKE